MLAVRPLDLFSQKVDINRRFQFQKRNQHFIGAHDETLSVAMRVNNPNCAPFNIES